MAIMEASEDSLWDVQRLQDHEVSLLEAACEVDAMAPHLRTQQDSMQDAVAPHLGTPEDFMREDEMDAAAAHLRISQDSMEEADYQDEISMDAAAAAAHLSQAIAPTWTRSSSIWKS